MSNPITIFDLDFRVALTKPLQVIWCSCDIDSINRSNDYVLKRVGNDKNFSNDIP